MTTEDKIKNLIDAMDRNDNERFKEAAILLFSQFIQRQERVVQALENIVEVLQVKKAEDPNQGKLPL
jgi:ATP-dependent helicase/DNAse subunit B